MLVTDPLVLEFQASVNKPFINFPALWKVSAQEVLTFCFLSLEMVSHSLPAACSWTTSLGTDSNPPTCFPALAFPVLCP